MEESIEMFYILKVNTIHYLR